MSKGDISGNIKETKRDEEPPEETKSLNKTKNASLTALPQLHLVSGYAHYRALLDKLSRKIRKR